MFQCVKNAAKNSEIDIFINISSIHAGTGGIHPYCDNDKSVSDIENKKIKRGLNLRSSYRLKNESPESLLDPEESNPNSPYGESKIKTENLTRNLLKNSNVKLGVSIRLGGVNLADNPTNDPRYPEEQPYYRTIYLSHEHLGNLLDKIINSGKNGYEQLYGISNHPKRIFSLENSFGWDPNNPISHTD